MSEYGKQLILTQLLGMYFKENEIKELCELSSDCSLKSEKFKITYEILKERKKLHEQVLNYYEKSKEESKVFRRLKMFIITIYISRIKVRAKDTEILIKKYDDALKSYEESIDKLKNFIINVCDDDEVSNQIINLILREWEK